MVYVRERNVSTNLWERKMRRVSLPFWCLMKRMWLTFLCWLSKEIINFEMPSSTKLRWISSVYEFLPSMHLSWLYSVLNPWGISIYTSSSRSVWNVFFTSNCCKSQSVWNVFFTWQKNSDSFHPCNWGNFLQIINSISLSESIRHLSCLNLSVVPLALALWFTAKTH